MHPMWQHLPKLDIITQQVLELRYFQNKTYEEIAHELNITIQEAKDQSTSGLRELKKRNK